MVETARHSFVAGDQGLADLVLYFDPVRTSFADAGRPTSRGRDGTSS